MKEIPIACGRYVVLVDDEDYEYLSTFKWNQAGKPGRFIYACRSARRSLGERGTTVLMHRVIMNAPSGMMVDHRDGNTLNNQRSNLRVCTRAQNMWNAKPSRNSTSSVKGVGFNRTSGKWIARVSVNGERKQVGTFSDKQSAIDACRIAATELHGEFAHAALRLEQRDGAR